MDTIPLYHFAVVATLRDKIVSVLFVSRQKKPAMLAMGRMLTYNTSGVALVVRRRNGIAFLFEVP